MRSRRDTHARHASGPTARLAQRRGATKPPNGQREEGQLPEIGEENPEPEEFRLSSSPFADLRVATAAGRCIVRASDQDCEAPSRTDQRPPISDAALFLQM